MPTLQPIQEAPTCASPSEKLGVVLWNIAQSNAATGRSNTVFDAPYQPSISLSAYLERMKEHMGCSDECFVLASLFLTRLETAQCWQGRTIILPLTVHRLCLVSVVLAAKVHDDIHASNSHYAAVGGIPISELNLLERTALMAMGYSTFVTPDEFNNCQFSLDSLYAAMTDDGSSVLDKFTFSASAPPAAPSTVHTSASAQVGVSKPIRRRRSSGSCRDPIIAHSRTHEAARVSLR